jgi:NACHT domain
MLLVIGFAGKVFGDLQNRWAGRVVEAVDRRMMWRTSRRVYLRQLRASVQYMETVGVATQGEYVLRMHDVYVDVSLVPQPLHAATGEPYLGTVPGGETGAGAGRRRSLESVLREVEQVSASRVLALIGGPGSGKTTLARNTALAMCEYRWHRGGQRLPVLLYLRDHAQALLADQAPGLGTVAASASWLGGKVPADWLERQLGRGGCVVLLDGLDEVADPAERGRVVDWVARQTDRHPHNIYVVTSRPHGYESNPLPRAEVLQVRRFTPQQVERFLRQWSYAVESRARPDTGRDVRTVADRNAEDLLARLRERPALYDLAANPLLLTMTANVHRYRGALPGSRAELYAEMCDVLLHRRAEVRGLHDATGLKGPQKQYVVQHLALAMMKARVRDWPVSTALQAVREPLRKVPGDVKAEVFLGEARKSGLLVEREHGVYGFAHLTLQEYLAAAQLGDSRAGHRTLTAGVDDPWWRETILLWAAGNDATDVITACLDSGAVPALALAFDCADQAKTVSPDVRERLDSLLTPAAPGQAADPARVRLLAGILATRTLRETIRLDDTTVLCANPVPRDLYDLFVRDEQAAGRFHHASTTRTEGGGDSGSAPAVGMQAADAERFIGWLNDITGDERYRLPTSEELADPAADMTAAGRYTIWAHNGFGAVLHQPPGAHWPYTPRTRQLRDAPGRDLRLNAIYLPLLVIRPSQHAQMESWVSTLIAGPVQGSESHDHRDLVLAVALARDLARAIARGSGSGFALANALAVVLAPDLARGLARDRDEALLLAGARELRLRLPFTLYLDLPHSFDPTSNPYRVLGLDADDSGSDSRVFSPDLIEARSRTIANTKRLDSLFDRLLAHDDDLDHTRSRVRFLTLYRARDLCRDLDSALQLARDLAGDLDIAPVRDLDLARDLDGALDRVRAFDPTRDRALDHAFARALLHALSPARDPRLDGPLNLDAVLDLARAYDLDHDRDLARDLARDLDHILALAFALGPGPGPDSTADPGSGPRRDPDLDLTVALDFALELALVSEPDATHHHSAQILDIASIVFRTLIHDEAGAVRLQQGAFNVLARTLTETGNETPSAAHHRVPEDPAYAVGRAHALIQADRLSAPRTASARLLVEQILELLSAIRDRRGPSDTRPSALARLALLVAAKQLQAVDQREAAGLLRLAWQSLVASDATVPGHPTPNQVLLIARTEQ